MELFHSKKRFFRFLKCSVNERFFKEPTMLLLWHRYEKSFWKFYKTVQYSMFGYQGLDGDCRNWMKYPPSTAVLWKMHTFTDALAALMGPPWSFDLRVNWWCFHTAELIRLSEKPWKCFFPTYSHPSLQQTWDDGKSAGEEYSVSLE